jgi:hypothetical protein
MILIVWTLLYSRLRSSRQNGRHYLRMYDAENMYMASEVLDHSARELRGT